MPSAIFRAATLTLALAGLLAGPAGAVVPPAIPLAQLAQEVMDFLVADVGEGGIRTNDNDAQGYPVPPYFYHYAAHDNNNLWTCGGGYPGYCSVSYPGYTASVGIDAFLAMRTFNGDPEMLARARQYADWILEHRTPAGGRWPRVPYSTQTDGVMGGGWDGRAIETDKPPMFALRLLRLYDITGEPRYWDAAVGIGDVLVANQLAGGPADDGRWPFRVDPTDGTVTQDYTSHLMPAVRLLDALATRTGDAAYATARDRAWQWLLNNPCNPASPHYMRWEAFYEDQSPEQQTGFGDHYSAHEMIVELAARRPAGWQQLAVAILDTVSARYLIAAPTAEYGQYYPITLEWSGWPVATYASSFQYARTALLLHGALAGDPLQDDDWYTRAMQMADVMTHGQNDRPGADDGRMFTTISDLVWPWNVDSWYEQNFNTVLYALEIMALAPERAPADENHVLSADHALTAITYGQGPWAIAYATASGAGRETATLSGPPAVVRAAGVNLPQVADPALPQSGWHWDATRQLLTVRHAASPVQIALSLVPAPAPPAVLTVGEPTPNPFNPRTTLAFTLPTATSCQVAVYGADGRRVRVIRAERLAAGAHTAVWDGQDDDGRSVAAGAYLLRVQAGNDVAIRRVVLLK